MLLKLYIREFLRSFITIISYNYFFRNRGLPLVKNSEVRNIACKGNPAFSDASEKLYLLIIILYMFSLPTYILNFFVFYSV